MNKNQSELDRIKLVYSSRSGSSRYSLLEISHLHKLQEVERVVLQMLRSNGWGSFQEKIILDLGCGKGFWLRRFLDWGAVPGNLSGIDALPDRVESAKHLLPNKINLLHGDAADMPWPDETFDLVSQFVVFSSILDPDIRMRVAEEMLRVLKVDGCLLWYDFFYNNPGNPDVCGINKKEILRLFPTCSIDIRRVTLAPPLARWIGHNSPWALGFFSSFYFLRTHQIAVIRKSVA